jgi:hypothetical protein
MICSATKPGYRLAGILTDTAPVDVHFTEAELRINVTRLGKSLHVNECLCIVALVECLLRSHWFSECQRGDQQSEGADGDSDTQCAVQIAQCIVSRLNDSAAATLAIRDIH